MDMASALVHSELSWGSPGLQAHHLPTHLDKQYLLWSLSPHSENLGELPPNLGTFQYNGQELESEAANSS